MCGVRWSTDALELCHAGLRGGVRISVSARQTDGRGLAGDEGSRVYADTQGGSAAVGAKNLRRGSVELREKGGTKATTVVNSRLFQADKQHFSAIFSINCYHFIL